MQQDDQVGTKYDRSYTGDSQLDSDVNFTKNSNGCGTSATDSEVEENFEEDGEREEEC